MVEIYQRLVEIGRVVLITQGKYEGKLAVIVNIIDGNRVLADGPTTGVPRGVFNFKSLQLTKFTVDISFGQRSSLVKAALEKAKIAEEWEKSAWAKKLRNRAIRKTLTDFDRWKLMKARQQRNRLVQVEFAKLKKAANAAGGAGASKKAAAGKAKGKK